MVQSGSLNALLRCPHGDHAQLTDIIATVIVAEHSRLFRLRTFASLLLAVVGIIIYAKSFR